MQNKTLHCYSITSIDAWHRVLYQVSIVTIRCTLSSIDYRSILHGVLSRLSFNFNVLVYTASSIASESIVDNIVYLLLLERKILSCVMKVCPHPYTQGHHSHVQTDLPVVPSTSENHESFFIQIRLHNRNGQFFTFQPITYSHISFCAQHNVVRDAWDLCSLK